MSFELVSCIMPTMEGRERFRRHAIECFKAQTWPHRELIVIDEPGTVGAKRNAACSRSSGEIIIHWDDDDHSEPERITAQVERLYKSDRLIVGYHSMRFLSENGEWWQYTGHQGYALGTSLCYRKDYWRRRPFKDLEVGEDNAFIQGVKVDSVDAGEIMYATIHEGNTSKRLHKVESHPGEWSRIET
jgi:glycosyltransferase involved in cell wall biosynthesis